MTQHNTFNHILDPFTRAALEAPAQNVDRLSLSTILDECYEHLQVDFDNLDLPLEVYAARAEALDLAHEAFMGGRHGDCHKHLRTFFMV